MSKSNMTLRESKDTISLFIEQLEDVLRTGDKVTLKMLASYIAGSEGWEVAVKCLEDDQDFRQHPEQEAELLANCDLHAVLDGVTAEPEVAVKGPTTKKPGKKKPGP